MADSTLAERSAERRRRMVGNHAHTFAEAERWDLEFWQSQTPQQRLAAFMALREDVHKAQEASDRHKRPNHRVRTGRGTIASSSGRACRRLRSGRSGCQRRTIALCWRRQNPMMPVVARFYGIVIKIYFSDHNPPHFHAVYGEYNGLFDIQTLEMIEGDLPSRAVSMVCEWAGRHQTTLLEMWTRQEFRKLPGIE